MSLNVLSAILLGVNAYLDWKDLPLFSRSQLWLPLNCCLVLLLLLVPHSGVVVWSKWNLHPLLLTSAFPAPCASPQYVLVQMPNKLLDQNLWKGSSPPFEISPISHWQTGTFLSVQSVNKTIQNSFNCMSQHLWFSSVATQNSQRTRSEICSSVPILGFLSFSAGNVPFTYTSVQSSEAQWQHKKNKKQVTTFSVNLTLYTSNSKMNLYQRLFKRLCMTLFPKWNDIQLL